MPTVIEILLYQGHHLFETFISGSGLLKRASMAIQDQEPVLDRLRVLVEHPQVERQSWQQSHLFQQLTDVIRTLAAKHPLVLILDDLQWVDSGSCSLLFLRAIQTA